MTTYEILRMNESLLTHLSSIGVSMNDVNNLGIYSEFMKMKKQGLKVRYIAITLADKYGISDRAIFKIVNRLGRNVVI